ncbi:MAG: HPr family phosphocarrier protein [Lachnospiraceae bacterium]
MSKQFGKYQLKSRYKGDKKMRVKFSTVEEVQNFAAKAGTMESDITIHSGNRYIIDGKSLMGIFSLDLSSPLEIEFLEKKQGEEEEFTKFCKAVGVMAE